MAMHIRLFPFTKDHTRLRLVTGYEDGSVKVWEINASMDNVQYGEFSLVASHSCFKNEPVMAMDSFNNTDWIIGSSNLATLYKLTLDPETGTIMHTRPFINSSHEHVDIGLSVVKYRPDGKLIFCGCCDGKIRIFTAKSGKYLGALTLHRLSVSGIQFTRQNWFMSTSLDKRSSLWSTYADQ